MEVEFKTYQELQKERKSRGAQFSHVTRRINNNEQLKGKTLELALNIVGNGTTGDKMRDSISNKLRTGQPLDDHEHHLIVDVILPHALTDIA